MGKIRYLGRSALTELEATLSAALQDWARDWLHEADITVDVRAVGVAEQAMPGDIRWQQFASSGATLHAGLTPADAHAIAEAMLGAESPAAPLLDEITATSLSDLATRVLGCGTPLSRSAHAPAIDTVRPCMGWAWVVMSLGGFKLTLLLDGTAVDRSLTPAGTVPPGLQPARDAVRDSPVALAARLDLGDIRVGELLQLKPGDVLVTKTALSEPLHLVVEQGGRTASRGHLGQHGGRRALVIVPDSTT